nr:hypothetical protein [uncultured Sulfurimonas sp.]
MGDFTSKYKVTYGNGITQTESRVDAGKVIDNGLVPLVYLAIIVITLIAAIPFLLLSPLFVYLYTPYKKVKDLLKSNKEIAEYSNDYLISKGYKNFGVLAGGIKIKFYLFMLVLIVACGFIDYYVFTNFNLKKLAQFSLEMLRASVPILLAYPIGFLLFHKNRKVLFNLLEVDSLFGQRLFRFTTRHYKKMIFFILLIVSTYFGHNIYFDYKAQSDFKYTELTYEMRDVKPTQENIAMLKEYMQENSIKIDDSFYGNDFLYGLAYKFDSIVYGEDFYKDEYIYIYKSLSRNYITKTVLESILTQNYYEDTYEKNYKLVFNMLKIYKELGGDINIKNTSTTKSSLGKIKNIESYYAAKKLGANFDDVKYEIITRIINVLGAKDKGYSKRLANLIIDIKPSKTIAKEILDENKYELKSNRQISALMALEKIAKD